MLSHERLQTTQGSHDCWQSIRDSYRRDGELGSLSRDRANNDAISLFFKSTRDGLWTMWVLQNRSDEGLLGRIYADVVEVERNRAIGWHIRHW